jgi:hypothetical protein
LLLHHRLPRGSGLDRVCNGPWWLLRDGRPGRAEASIAAVAAVVPAAKDDTDNNESDRYGEAHDQADDEADQALRLQGSLMGWKDGVLVVNFSDDLVRFLREVRQLDELGFEIPKGGGRKGGKRGGGGIAEKAFEAEKYYRYGILLKKTANF